MPSCSCRRRSLGSGMPSSIAAAAGLVMPLILPLVQQDQDNNWLTETAGQPACRSLTAGDLSPGPFWSGIGGDQPLVQQLRILHRQCAREGLDGIGGWPAVAPLILVNRDPRAARPVG